MASASTGPSPSSPAGGAQAASGWGGGTSDSGESKSTSGASTGPSASSPAGGAQAASGWGSGTSDSGSSAESHDGPSPSSPAGGAQAASGWGSGTTGAPPSYESFGSYEAITKNALDKANSLDYDKFSSFDFTIDVDGLKASIADKAQSMTATDVTYAPDDTSAKFDISNYDLNKSFVNNDKTVAPVDTTPPNDLAGYKQQLAQNEEALEAAKTLSSAYRDIVTAGIEANIAATKAQIATYGFDKNSDESFFADSSKKAAELASMYANAGDAASTKAARDTAESYFETTTIFSQQQFQSIESEMDAAQRQLDSYRTALDAALDIKDLDNQDAIMSSLGAHIAAAEANIIDITARMEITDGYTYDKAEKIAEYAQAAQEAAKRADEFANSGKPDAAYDATVEAIDYSNLARETLDRLNIEPIGTLKDSLDRLDTENEPTVERDKRSYLNIADDTIRTVAQFVTDTPYNKMQKLATLAVTTSDNIEKISGVNPLAKAEDYVFDLYFNLTE